MTAKSTLSRLLKIPTNKYVIALVVFGVWMFFFDKHNVFTLVELQSTINELEEEKKFYQTHLEELKLEKKEMLEHEEKYAREKYFMHKENEEVYVIRYN